MTVGSLRREDGRRDVRAWVAELSTGGLAPATVQKAYQLLGKIMGAAVDAGMLAQSPCRRVPLPKVEREEMRFLTPAEVARVADVIDRRYRVLVLIAATVAAHRGAGRAAPPSCRSAPGNRRGRGDHHRSRGCAAVRAAKA